MSIAQDLIADFQREAPNHKKVLDAVPEAKLGWKPHAKSMSVAQLAGHIAETPTWLGAIFEDEMDFAQMGDYKPFLPASKAELLATYSKNYDGFAGQLKGKDDAFLRGKWKMRMGDKVLMESPRHEVIRDILIHHAVHHRGQLTVYLRLLDQQVPATYGNTADFPNF